MLICAHDIDAGLRSGAADFPGPLSHFFFVRAREIETIAADDAVTDDEDASFSDLLFFLLGLRELTRITEGDGASEAISDLDLVDLLLEGLLRLLVRWTKGDNSVQGVLADP